MQHLDEGTIHAWLDGALPPSEAAAVEAHVAQCAECAALVAEARGLIAGTSRIVSSLDHVPAGVIPKAHTPPSSLWHTLRLTPARASIAALILVGVASMFATRRGQLEQPVVRSTIAPQIAPSSALPALDSTRAPSLPVATTPSVPQPKATAKREVAELAKPAPPPATEMRTAAPALEAVTTTGVVASKAAADVAAVDSVRVQREARRAEANFSGASAPAAASPRMMRQSFAPSAASPEGCYRLLTDSARSIVMPERFALQRDSIGRNIVVRLTVENRRDSVLSGFAWRQTSPATALLTAPTTQLLLTTNESGRARLEAANEKIEVPLQRTVCRP